MSQPLKIPIVGKELGETIIYELYRGNFECARKVAEENLQMAQNRKRTDDVLADALLARGIVHLLQGEPTAALKHFQEIEQTFPNDNNRRLQAFGYAHLANCLEYNLFPDNGGAHSAEINLRWNPLNDPYSNELTTKTIFEKATSPQIKFEFTIANDFLFCLQPMRAIWGVRNSTVLVEDLKRPQPETQLPNQVTQLLQNQNAPDILRAYANLVSADLFWRRRNALLAKQFVTKAHQIFNDTQDFAGMGACNVMWGDWFAARFSNPLVLNFSVEESSTGGSSLAWNTEKEEFTHNLSDVDQTKAAYTFAEDYFIKADAPRGLAHVQLRYGYLAFLQKNYAEAISYIQKAQDLFSQSGDRLGYRLAQIHNILMGVANCQYPEELSVAQEIGKWGAIQGSFSYTVGLGLLLGRVGRHWLIREGDYERALACFRLASSLFKTLGVPINFAGTLTDQSSIYRNLGDRTGTIVYSEQAMDAYEEDLTNRPNTATRNIINSLMQGTALYNSYLKEMDTAGMERIAQRLRLLVNKAKTINFTEDPQKKSEPLVADREDNGTKDFDSTMVNMVVGLADNIVVNSQVCVPLYKAKKAKDQGDETQAEMLFDEALKQAKNDPNESNGHLSEAMVLGFKKEYPQALESFRQYVKAKTSKNDQIIEMLKRFGDAGQAEIKRSQENDLEMAFTFLVKIKAYDQAKVTLNQLVQLSGEDWPQREDHPWESLASWAETFEFTDELENALLYYNKAIAEFETRRAQLSHDELKTAAAGDKGIQFLYFQATRTAFKLRQDAVEQNHSVKIDLYSKQIFQLSERGRARSLIDLMAGNLIPSKISGVEDTAMRDWREVNAQLATWLGLIARERSEQKPSPQRIVDLTLKVEELQLKLQKIENQLSSSNPNFYRSINPQVQTISLSEIISKLPVGTAIIQYYFLGEELLSWAITNQGMTQIQFAKVDAASLNLKIKRYHDGCEACSNIDQLGIELTDIFLSPLAETIHANKSLFVIPYGASHMLPFHALPLDGQPLGTNHTVSYLPNASVLQYIGETISTEVPDSILAIGNPANMYYQDPTSEEKIPCQPLLGARVEAAYVASLFTKGRALLEDEATEENVRKLISQYPLVHFATHGHLSEDAPLLSSIMLANGDELTVYELAGMKLQASLVVLSACRTGQGTTTEGEDVLGLTRGLLGAGVQAAIVSLWPVNDLSTSLLMGEFYRQLKIVKNGARALQMAQNYLRTLEPQKIEDETAKLRDAQFSRGVKVPPSIAGKRDYSHPYFWAPFIYIG